ncbi:hypothetical protein MPH_02402 [Macrophomina phaseolina MS6]|uniref:Uncharacterized protein n=1 Tax=Macrophomina phaseolina (strain MS6) TaxID=1126212 RepID=K2SCZ5_MACPH|nr:hypothetical protein MPH_02402 [Macrophomina phaseolina MS6]
MALPPLPRHARALLGALLAAQLPCARVGHVCTPPTHPGDLPPPQILHPLRLLRHERVVLEHGLPHARHPLHREDGLLRGRCVGHVRPLLHAHPHLALGPRRQADAAERAPRVDAALPRPLRRARRLPHPLDLGLHVQHGRQRRRWRRPQPHVVLVQHRPLPPPQAHLGRLARPHRRLDHHGHEPRATRLPALDGHDRRACLVASGNRPAGRGLVCFSDQGCRGGFAEYAVEGLKKWEEGGVVGRAGRASLGFPPSPLLGYGLHALVHRNRMSREER